MTKTIAQKGVWAEAIAKAHFSIKKHCLVYEPLSGVGLCDLVVLNTHTGDTDKYDVKFCGMRFFRGKMRPINRVASDKQKKLNIKIIYVMEDGTIRIPERRKWKTKT